MDRTFFIILSGRVLQVVLSLMAVRIFTSILSAAEVGNLYLVNSIVAFFGLVMINPVGMYINRKLHKWSDEGTIFNYFFVFNCYLVALSVLSIPVVFSLHQFSGVGGNIDIFLLSIFIMVNIYFNTWNQTIIPSLNMLNHRKSFVVFTIMTLGLGLAFSIAMTQVLNPSAVVWLSGQLLAQALLMLVAFVYFKKVTGSSCDFGFIKGIVSRKNFGFLVGFALPLGITTFFMWVQNQSYRMIIEKYVGLEFLALIGLGMGIAASISGMVESLVQQIYYPIFYSQINTADPVERSAAWDRMAQLTIPIYVSVTLLVSCLAPFLVRILVNEKFSQAFVFVIFGAWVEFFRMTTNILSAVAHAEMQTKSLVKAYFAGGVVASAGVYFGAGFESYQHIIPTILVFSGFVTTVCMYLNMKKLMRINIGFNRIAKAALYSLPVFVAWFFYTDPVSMQVAVSTVASFGLYFLAIQYNTYRKSSC